MLQIEGNICAQEVVQVRSQHSRYVIPPLPRFLSPRKQQKTCDGVMRACGCIEFYKSPPVSGAPELCRQLLPRELQRMKAERQGAALQCLGKAGEQPSTLRNPSCLAPDQQVPGKPLAQQQGMGQT